MILAAGAIASLVVRKLIGLSGPSTAGLFCGAITSTPALAAAVDAAKNLSTTSLPKSGTSI